MNEYRKKFCLMAFDMMDSDKSGLLEIEDIRAKYNAKKHPDVKSGKKTEDEVLLEFLETFEAHHNLYEGTESDHIITKEEWLEYYENVSVSIDDDKYFELMMANAWGFAGNTTYNNKKKGWSAEEESPNKGTIQGSYKKKIETSSKKIDSSKETVTSKIGGFKSASKKIEEEDNEDANINKSPEEKLLGKFRERLLSRGGRGFIGLVYI
jgi:hypothetical protein